MLVPYYSSAYNIGYRKIPIISPGLIFVQIKGFLLGLFSLELIFGGANYWREFFASKLVGLDNKNSLKKYEKNLKQLKTVIWNMLYIVV